MGLTRPPTEAALSSSPCRDRKQRTRPLCCRRPPLGPKDFGNEARTRDAAKIIREWMALPKDKRQTEEQAKPFAKKAMERIPSSGDPYRQIMRWLLPRIGKP
jgi:hypothetical protein